MRKAIQLSAGIAIAAGGVYVFLHGADLDKLGNELASANIWLVLFCAVMSIFSLVLRAVRWRLILPPSKGAHTNDLFSHTVIGFMVNNILPARIGEGVRGFLLWKKNGFPAAVSVGSLVLERVLDVLVFMLFFAVPVLALQTLDNLRHAAFAVLAIVLMVAIMLALCSRYPRIIAGGVRILRHVTPKRFHERINTLGIDLASVLDWTFSLRRVAGVIVLSIAIPLSYAIGIVILANDYQSFGLMRGLFVLAFAVVGTVIPLAPGYVGTLHATMLQSIVLLDLPIDEGRALAVLFHAVGYIPVTLVGFIYFLKADMSIKEVSKMQKALEE
jgi:hypothetical protein